MIQKSNLKTFFEILKDCDFSDLTALKNEVEFLTLIYGSFSDWVILDIFNVSFEFLIMSKKLISM